MGPQIQTMPYTTEVQFDISGLPFISNKGLQILSKTSRYLEVGLKVPTNQIDYCQKEAT